MAASAPQSDPPVLTAEGRERIQQRLDRALEALNELSERMKSGERGADEVAEQQRLVTTVNELSDLLARATDVANVDEDPSIVEVGDEVDVEDEDGVATYALVHPAEASARDGRISITSPLGRALLGARPGERVVVNAPSGPYTCTVKARRRLS